MALFKKRVTCAQMGIIVCETARIRCENFYKECEEKELDFKPAALQVYTFVYNYFFISKVLLKKYNYETVKKIMQTAYDVFIKMSKEIFSAAQMRKLENDILFTFDWLNDIYSFGEDRGAFDNPIYNISKMFIEDITGESVYDIVLQTEIQVEISAWIKFSDFLLTEYKVVD